MYESYEVGAQCWIPSPAAGWVGAEVTARREVGPSEVEVELLVDGGETVTKKLTEDPSPALPLRNPPQLEATSDLVTLSYLNEPSVLNAIRQRYSHLNIYTFSGIVLIATNPFARVDNLYTDEVVQMYNQMEREQLEPHLFSIAAEAFRCMKRDNADQTIVVSGESGAGKTMSAKYIMRYFATVEDPQKRAADPDTSHDLNDDVHGLSRVEREILATNPIMEAFGNAKTTRNDNSSRFGKYLEIRFDNSYEISGAKIRTYLLERSRIVFHPDTERNYHIFYQMMKGLTPSQLAELGLEGGLASFAYINAGSPDIEGVDDAADFHDTQAALGIVGVDETQQWRVLEILAALLHLGNIGLKPTSNSVLVSPEDPHLLHAARLLGVPSHLLAKWLVKKLIKVRTESSESSLDIKAATVVRDSISKYLYTALFDWLVAAVNAKLFTGNTADRFIGVLDIYGFEHFKHNSFEQFCINYANEKLQQEFNQHVFKLEQNEYAAEEIDWQYIDFVDNQPCIDLIESKTGILGLLDDESRVPSGSDDGFTQKLYGQLTGKPSFRKPRLGENSFIVSHYAHDVEYETAGFIEKNRDTVPDTIIDLLQGSENPFLKTVLDTQQPEEPPQPPPQQQQQQQALRPGPRGGALKRPTLGNIFKTSLIELMKTISSTNAHYIRCIKPNEEKKPWTFNGPMVLSQLRACGVLETIRISSKGFPGRHNYADFASRYEVLLDSAERKAATDPQTLAETVLKKYSDDGPGQYALGKTKVFYRAGMLAHLEKCRTKRTNSAATTIQSHVRMRQARTKLFTTLAFVRNLQTAVRAHMSRERLAKAQAERAIVGFQAAIRRYLARRELALAQTAVIGVQQRVRTIQALARLERDGREQAAVALQSLVRRQQARAAYARQVGALTTVQSMVRRRGARRQLQQLREDQHSVKHYEEAQYRMENKVVELQNLLSQKRDDHKSTTAELAAVQATLAAAEAKYSDLSTEHGTHRETAAQQQRELQSAIDKHQGEAAELRSEVHAQVEKMSSLQDTVAEQEQKLNELTLENQELRKKNQDLEEQVHLAQTTNIGAGSLMYQRTHTGGGESGVARSAPAYTGGQPHTAAALDENQLSEEEAQVNDQIEKFLRQDSVIKEELLTNLVKTLQYPQYKLGDSLPSRDALFPSNITNLIVSELWRFGFLDDSEGFLSAVMSSIQNVVDKGGSTETVLTMGPFWMTNAHQIYSFMALADANINNSEYLREQMASEELTQYQTLINLATTDSESTIFNIYFVYMKWLKKSLEKVMVSAIIDDQTIPGFKTETSQGIFQNFFSSSNHFKMDDLIMLFNKVLAPLQTLDLEHFYITQIFEEMVTFIGTKTFNDMIMRRNFLTWRRAVQINYNVTRLAEWLKFHKLDSAVAPLENITQASKLLQLKKNWEDDIDFLFDVFWSLNPSQIHRLMSNYQPLDYETPVSSHTLERVSEKIRDSPNANTQIALKVRSSGDAGPFQLAPPRMLENLEPYIPHRVHAPVLREFTEYTTRASRLAQEAQLAHSQEAHQ